MLLPKDLQRYKVKDLRGIQYQYTVYIYVYDATMNMYEFEFVYILQVCMCETIFSDLHTI